jgi:hypothetical protein
VTTQGAYGRLPQASRASLPPAPASVVLLQEGAGGRRAQIVSHGPRRVTSLHARESGAGQARAAPPVALRHERRHSAQRGMPSAAGGRATYPNTRCRGSGEGDRAPCRAGRLRASLSSAAARRWRCRPKVGPFSAQKTGETAPSAEDQEKGERNFHPFVEMIRLTLGVKTLQSVGIWRERAPQGGK